MTLLGKIQNYSTDATLSEKKIIDYIHMNPHNIIGYTSKDLATKLSISNSTITRFCQNLGYKGYIDFSKSLFEELRKTSPNSDNYNQSQKLNSIVQSLDETSSTLHNVLNSDLINLTETFETFSLEKFEEIVKFISQCDKVYIVGFNSCKMVAEFIHFHLDRIGYNTELITCGSTTLIQKLGRPNQKQCIFLVSFPQYSKDSKTVVKISKMIDAPLIVMTDKDNDLTKNALYSIIVKTENNYTFYNSMVAPMAIANAFITTCSIQNTEQTKEYLDYAQNKLKVTTYEF